MKFTKRGLGISALSGLAVSGAIWAGSQHIDAIQGNVDRLTDMVAVLVGESGDMLARHNIFRNNAGHTINGLRDEIDVLEETVEEKTEILEEKRDLLATKQTTITNQKTLIQNKVELIEGKEILISDKTSQIASLNQQVQDLEASLSASYHADYVATLRTEIGRLEALVAELQGEVDADLAELASLRVEVTELRTQVTTLTSDRDAAQGEVTRLTNELATANAEIDSLRGQIYTLSNNLETGQAEISRLEGELNRANTEIAALAGNVQQQTNAAEALFANRSTPGDVIIEIPERPDFGQGTGDELTLFRLWQILDPGPGNNPSNAWRWLGEIVHRYHSGTIAPNFRPDINWVAGDGYFRMSRSTLNQTSTHVSISFLINSQPTLPPEQRAYWNTSNAQITRNAVADAVNEMLEEMGYLERVYALNTGSNSLTDFRINLGILQ